MSKVTKRCFKCGEIKELSAFYKHSQMADGHLNKCKECTKSDTSNNRINKIDYYREYDRNRPNKEERNKEKAKRCRERFANDEDYRNKSRLQDKDWIRRNPHKDAAHNKVGNAVRDGKLNKPSVCSCCGYSEGRIHGHHWSYLEENWLDVVWLCASCHGKEHKRINENIRNSKEPYENVSSAEDALELLIDYLKTK